MKMKEEKNEGQSIFPEKYRGSYISSAYRKKKNLDSLASGHLKG